MRPPSWATVKDHIEMFVDGADQPGDYIKAERLKNGKWRITSRTGNMTVVGEHEDFRVALCYEKGSIK